MSHTGVSLDNSDHPVGNLIDLWLEKRESHRGYPDPPTIFRDA